MLFRHLTLTGLTGLRQYTDSASHVLRIASLYYLQQVFRIGCLKIFAIHKLFFQRRKNVIILYTRKPYVKEIKAVLKYHDTVDISINGPCGFGGSVAKARGLTSFRGS